MESQNRPYALIPQLYLSLEQITQEACPATFGYRYPSTASYRPSPLACIGKWVAYVRRHALQTNVC
jgi:hypothetical protein